MGRGPGLVLVQGALGTAHNYDQFARLLANDFTVYLPDRRGRGMSPRAYESSYRVARDVEDLDALLCHTGAQFVYGLSSGAIITLEAARLLPSIRKAAIYEPPFQLNGTPRELIARFNREIAAGRHAAALVTAQKIVKLSSPRLNLVPHAVLSLFCWIVLKLDDAMGAAPYARFRELLPSMRYDFAVVSELGEAVQSFKTVEIEVLLLSGTRSPTYLKEALIEVEKWLPRARRIDLDGVDHSASWNADRGGQPEVVARVVRDFFAGKGA